jgi:putative membrane protein
MSTRGTQSADAAQDPRIYLAAERTFLAWIRTGVALMAFGFVVARFGLLLRELHLTLPDHKVSSLGISTPAGIGLVLTGIVVNVASTLDYISTVQRLKRGEILNRPSKLAIALSLGLAGTGCLLAAYLVAVP